MVRRHFTFSQPDFLSWPRLRIPATLLIIFVSSFYWNLNSTAATKGPFRCSWKKVQPKAVFSLSSIELDQIGNGKFRFQKLESDLVTVDFRINGSKVALLYNLFLQADFLNEAKNFASQRKVADMGTKTIRFESGQRNREVTFNYTEDKTLQEINNFFENLDQQEKDLFELELALKYDRLGIPKKLDALEQEFSANRIVAPERFKPILEKISEDDSLINLARKEARKLLSKVSKMQLETH